MEDYTAFTKLSTFPGRDQNEHNDCMIRSMAVLTALPYEEVRAEYKSYGRDHRRRTSWSCTKKFAKKHGLAFHTCRMSYKRFIEDMEHVPVCVAGHRGHAFACVYGRNIDEIHVSDRRIIVYYYTRKP